eukprot:1350016-Pyramimonas_sp.AAC.1
MQPRVAQGAAPYSYIARRGTELIAGHCGASVHRRAELRVGHNPRERNPETSRCPRASPPTEAA